VQKRQKVGVIATEHKRQVDDGKDIDELLKQGISRVDSVINILVVSYPYSLQ
jgi:hypothetical protein